MTRLYEEWAVSAIITAFEGDEPSRCTISHCIIGDRAWAEKCLAECVAHAESRERKAWSIKPHDFELHRTAYMVWDDHAERMAAERVKRDELVAAGLRVDPAVRWSVEWDRPEDEPQLRLSCDGVEMLVPATQEAVDKACANPVLVDRSISSTGGSYWSETD